MLLWWLLGSLAAGAVLSAMAGRSRLGALLGPTILVVACGLGLRLALGDGPGHWTLPLPVGSGALRLDALSRWFLLPLFSIGAVVAVYGVGYLHHQEGRRHLGAHWALVLLLVLGMTLVFLADDGFVFLVGWELMSVAPFFLVAWEDEAAAVRDAAWEYLVAAHLGAAALLAGFALAAVPGGWSFAAMRAALPGAPLAPAVLALWAVGCGAKAGLAPAHVWLPEAHPAAPSHISALMSGLVVNAGIYGLLRGLELAGLAGVGAGAALLLVGLGTALYGALQALVQDNAKRLLACSTVENMGLVTLALGTSLIGLAHGHAVTAWLGMLAALLHLLHHSLFKTLLFLGVGAVLESTGTVRLNELGGLAQRMPWTSRLTAVGVATVAGVPPFCGLVGELLLFAALATGLGMDDAGSRALMAGGFVGLALVSGLVLAGGARLVGLGFLGAPRTPKAQRAADPDWRMRGPMAVTAAGCLLAMAAAPVLLGLALPAGGVLLGTPPADALAPFVGMVAQVAQVSLVLAGVVIALAGLRRCLPGLRDARRFRTWDCGYAAPSPRMQYTAFGFAHPLWRAVGGVTGCQVAAPLPAGYFPAPSSAEVRTPDPIRTWWARLFELVRAGCDALKWFQHGRIQLYVCTMAAVLLGLIVWQLGW